MPFTPDSIKLLRGDPLVVPPNLSTDVAIKTVDKRSEHDKTAVSKNASDTSRALALDVQSSSSVRSHHSMHIPTIHDLDNVEIEIRRARRQLFVHRTVGCIALEWTLIASMVEVGDVTGLSQTMYDATPLIIIVGMVLVAFTLLVFCKEMEHTAYVSLQAIGAFLCVFLLGLSGCCLSAYLRTTYLAEDLFIVAITFLGVYVCMWIPGVARVPQTLAVICLLLGAIASYFLVYQSYRGYWDDLSESWRRADPSMINAIVMVIFDTFVCALSLWFVSRMSECKKPTDYVLMSVLVLFEAAAVALWLVWVVGTTLFMIVRNCACRC